MEWITAPWPWYVAGPMIALIMFVLLAFGKEFGFSANLRTMCAAVGGGKYASFFKFNWKGQIWNLVFAVGAILGGYIAHTYLMPSEKISLNPKTVAELETYGLSAAGEQYIPPELFGWDYLATWQGFVMMVVGGFLIGFGTRYAGGCTSGHAISGLSNLQWPSLLAVIGFFIGGLLMTYLGLPFLLPGQ
ncbi:YeeE/YedE family protein [Cryomorphaceae bacterium]|nr:YeeE/YedE family protein [Cryomorphaceae bacterium]